MGQLIMENQLLLVLEMLMNVLNIPCISLDSTVPSRPPPGGEYPAPRWRLAQDDLDQGPCLPGARRPWHALRRGQAAQ